MRHRSLFLRWVALLAAAAVFSAPVFAADAPASAPDSVWPPEKAWAWYKAQPWLCGFNYVPANDISYTQMWMAGGYDHDAIARELALAPPIGFNCLRVVLSYVDWQGDPEGFLKRFDDFLGLCRQNGLRVLPCFFDDCCFGPIEDPVFGPQPEVVPGWYANGWTPSPGHKRSVDPAVRPDLKRYVDAVMQAHRDDPRILAWDLYNESGNAKMGEATLPLLEDVFAWARADHPSQPVTSGYWGNRKLGQSKFLLANSDIITFHNYAKPPRLVAEIADLKKRGRPVICTEWMNRNSGSTVADCLPVFAAQDVGCLNWGLVNGKTQTNLNWGHRPGRPDPPRWQHDLFRGDLTPYDPAEIALFRGTIAKMRGH